MSNSKPRPQRQKPVLPNEVTEEVTLQETPVENKYQPKEKVGKPSISAPGGKVTSVGLGKLNVTTNGSRTYL